MKGIVVAGPHLIVWVDVAERNRSLAATATSSARRLGVSDDTAAPFMDTWKNWRLNASTIETGDSMPEEFEGDLAGAVFWGADLSGARFRDVNLTDVKITHAWLVDVDIDALVDKVVINGVDVTGYVNERDPWYPLRSMLRAPDPAGMRAAWSTLQDEWAQTVTRALALPEDRLHESVNDEWSFVQTLRHLVFAMDKWFTVPILGETFHPIGMPNTGSVDFPWPGLDYDLTPSVSEALAVRADRAAHLRDYLASVAPSDLTGPVDVLENGTNPVQECIYTVFEEEFWHNRYALRDLAELEAR